MRTTRNFFSSLKNVGAMCLATGLLLSIPSCSSDPVPYVAPVIHATGVSLNKTSSGLVMGSTLTLTATVAPANAANTAVTWSSDNQLVATVAAGVVPPVSTGTANIKVTTADGGFTASCAVTVTAATVSVTGVSLNKATATIAFPGTLQLTATVVPANATNTAVTWTSGTPANATVNSAGLVTAVKEGSSIITVTTADGSKTATCTVTVSGPYLYGFTNTGQIYTFDMGAGTWSSTPTNTSTVPTGVTLSFVVSADGNTFYGFSGYAVPPATTPVPQGTIYQLVGPTTGTWALASSMTNAAPGSPTTGLTFDGTYFETLTNTGKPSIPPVSVSGLTGGAWGVSTTLTGGKVTTMAAAYYDGTNWWAFTPTGSLFEAVGTGATPNTPSLSWTAASTGATGGALVSVCSDGTTFYGITATGLIYSIPVATAEGTGSTAWSNPYTATCGGTLVAVVYN